MFTSGFNTINVHLKDNIKYVKFISAFIKVY